jgi:hypothetical protein
METGNQEKSCSGLGILEIEAIRERAGEKLRVLFSAQKEEAISRLTLGSRRNAGSE